MNLDEFETKYSEYHSHAKITIDCECPDCIDRHRVVTKTTAKQTIKNNGKYYCRACSMKEYYKTNPDRSKCNKTISEKLTGIKRSEESRRKMSQSKKEYYQTDAGKETKKVLSHHGANNFKIGQASRRKGYYPSIKNEAELFWESSYELRAMYLLDNNDDVDFYKAQKPFVVDGRSRRLDLLVYYKNGYTEVIEVKAFRRLGEEDVKLQIEDNNQYAKEHKHGFKLWTEGDLGFSSEREITAWADKFIGEMQGVDYESIRKKKHCEKNKLYRERHDEELHTTFWCEFCGEEHRRLIRDYDKNVAKNGRYICIKENGQIIGKRPKKKKENPYAAEGKKQCIEPSCLKILEFKFFNPDSSRSDGYSNICSECNRKKCNERYQKRKGKKNGPDNV